MFKSLIARVAGLAGTGGLGIGTWAAIIGGAMLVAAAGATYVTANYYNKLIVASSTTAAANAWTKAQQAQLAVDRKQMAAMQADYARRLARERADAAKVTPVIRYIRTHSKPDPAGVCTTPKAMIDEINKVLQ